MAVSAYPFTADKRFYAIILAFPTVEDRIVNILIPPGYEVESLPESTIVQLNNGAGTFKFIIAQNGNFLRVVSNMDLKNIVYTPQDYESLKKFYAQVVEKHAEAIVLTKS